MSLLLLIFLTILLIIAIGFRFIRNIFLSIFPPRKEKEIKRTEQPAEKDDFKVGDLSDAKEVEFKKE